MCTVLKMIMSPQAEQTPLLMGGDGGLSGRHNFENFIAAFSSGI